MCSYPEKLLAFHVLQNKVQTPEFDIYHYDLYRLERPSEIFELGVEEAFYSGVSLVEWPESQEWMEHPDCHLAAENDEVREKVCIKWPSTFPIPILKNPSTLW